MIYIFLIQKKLFIIIIKKLLYINKINIIIELVDTKINFYIEDLNYIFFIIIWIFFCK